MVKQGSDRILAFDDDPNHAALTCVESRREQAAGERGWRAYLTVDEHEPAEAVVYCPACAAREFGASPDRPPKM
jgi:hypothetical protein